MRDALYRFTLGPALCRAGPGDPGSGFDLLRADPGERADGPFDLLAAYGYPNPFNDGLRVDARLSEDADGELLLALKSTGQVLRLEADVPEPATWMLLAGLLGAGAMMHRADTRRMGA